MNEGQTPWTSAISYDIYIGSHSLAVAISFTHEFFEGGLHVYQ